ncbi:MAG TPA: hypothetical protein VNN09_06205 [Candidatus Competibacteraceae bacterium]|nr:hypothetical protein [Candidatus Competibacteraceae bacterium]
MAWNPDLWRRLSRLILSPKPDDAGLEERLAALRAELPVPVFWLLGKSQSGKTALIRALTGREDAEIGNGWEPCTGHSRLYDFPDGTPPILRFLDTRGLGEVDYDPAADLALFGRQAHLLIVVARALDPAQESVLAALAHIRKARPQWPLLVVQSCLHHGYPSPASEHLLPYPYHQDPLPPQVPPDLARALLAQRRLFAGYDARFVAVDFTQPEDGYIPQHYGLEALWAAIEAALPLGLRALLESHAQLGDAYARAAHPHIVAYALLAGAAELIPVPGASLPLVLAVQAKLCQSLASLYGQPLNRRLAEIGTALGSGWLLRLGGRQLMKLVPAYGTAVAALASAATSYALGRVLCRYLDGLRRGSAPEAERLAAWYAEELERGRALLRQYFQRAERP